MWWVGGREVFQKLVGNRSGGIFKCPSIAAALADVKSHQNLECNATKLLCVRSQNWLLVDYCQWCWHILKACCWWNFFFLTTYCYRSISPQHEIAAGLTTQWQLGEAGIARWQLVSQAVIRLPGRGVWDNPRLWLSRKCRMPAWAEATRRRIARSRGPTRISPSGRRTDPRAWVWLCAAVHLKRTQPVIRPSLTERPTQPLLVQLFRKISS